MPSIPTRLVSLPDSCLSSLARASLFFSVLRVLSLSSLSVFLPTAASKLGAPSGQGLEPAHSVLQASCPESKAVWAQLKIVTTWVHKGEKRLGRGGSLPWLHFQGALPCKIEPSFVFIFKKKLTNIIYTQNIQQFQELNSENFPPSPTTI